MNVSLLDLFFSLWSFNHQGGHMWWVAEKGGPRVGGLNNEQKFSVRAVRNRQ